MNITMDISHINTVPEIEKFLNNSESYQFQSASGKQERYEWLRNLLITTKYTKLKKKKKGIVKNYILKGTRYSDQQIKRLLNKHKYEGLKWKKWQTGNAVRIYSHEDIVLLHEVDSAHKLSGKSTKKILERTFNKYGQEKFKKLSDISVSHIYNLRKRPSYQRMGQVFDKTKYHNVSIGKRMKPRPEGRPGFLRVDSVHQGDLNGDKGVYFINMVDEVLQWELVFCVPQICEKYMKPVLEMIIELCPFMIINFHSDNGSEYINKIIADILNRLHIQQTKSRPRKHNDNALVEGKNGSIVRKHFGYSHIPATEHNARILNIFCINYLNIYLNYHRPCGFATTTIDHKGKEKKKYERYLTPYEKLKSLQNASKWLKDNQSFEKLDQIEYFNTDTEFANIMNQEKQKAFLQLKF